MSIINIEPEYLVVCTGYDERYEDHKEEIDADIQTMNDELEDDKIKILGIEEISSSIGFNFKEGLMFKVGDISNVSNILNMYTNTQMYCKCFEYIDMKYNIEKKTLYVEFDAESG